jgi:hypothetical protein
MKFEKISVKIMLDKPDQVCYKEDQSVGPSCDVARVREVGRVNAFSLPTSPPSQKRHKR